MRARSARSCRRLRPFSDRNVEIIVVDGTSTDDTAMLARPLADQVIRSPHGLGLQMNEGAKVASGFIFLFLRPETVLPADADTQVMFGRARDTSVWGRFDLRIAGRHMLLPLVARCLNWRSRRVGHRHRRSGDLRAARDVFPGRRLQRYSGDGRRRTVPAAESDLAADLRRIACHRAGRALRPTGSVAHIARQLDDAAALPDGRKAGGTGEAVRT